MKSNDFKFFSKIIGGNYVFLLFKSYYSFNPTSPLKDCFRKNGYNFDDVSKIGSFLKEKCFKITSVHGKPQFFKDLTRTEKPLFWRCVLGSKSIIWDWH